MPDPIEARMNFIVEQQAQFAAGIPLFKERQSETQGMIRQLVDVTMSLARHAEQTDRRIDKLGVELHQLGAETYRRIRELVESGAHTDRRLDALIDTVDKLTRRNGS